MNRPLPNWLQILLPHAKEVSTTLVGSDVPEVCFIFAPSQLGVPLQSDAEVMIFIRPDTVDGWVALWDKDEAVELAESEEMIFGTWTEFADVLRQLIEKAKGDRDATT